MAAFLPAGETPSLLPTTVERREDALDRPIRKHHSDRHHHAQ